MTEDVEGIKLKASDFRTYPALSDGLDSLHKLFLTVPVNMASLKTGVLDNVEALKSADSDHPLVKDVLVWVQERIGKSAEIPEGNFLR